MDCHIHTKNSDGLSSMQDIVLKCKELKLDCFAITDHDTIFELKKIEENNDNNMLFGTEITTFFAGVEIHILAYFSKVPSNDFEIFLRNNRIKNGILKERSQRRKEIDCSYNTVEEVTRNIRKYDGLSIIAHPYNYWNIVDQIINYCDGLELIYPSFAEKDIDIIIERYGDKCRFFTAGSDFHGSNYTGNSYINECCQKYRSYLEAFLKYFNIKP